MVYFEIKIPFSVLLIAFVSLNAYMTNVNALQGQMRKSHEQKIIDKIFHEHHDPYVRPIKKREDTIVVHIGITYHQLIDVNEKDQIITSSIWIRQNWTSKLLTWNKTEFGSVGRINTDPGNVWKPDLYLYNNADESSDGGQHSFNTKVKVFYDGINLWLAPTIIKTACKINVEHFPFDEQYCDVTLGSWTYDTYRLNVLLERSEADTSKFVSNGEWNLISIKGRRNEFKYPCCDEPYADLTYTIRIRRRTRFYYINLIIPCVLITALSILTFKVPPDTGERITLVITNLLSMIVFLLLVADILPPISDATPLISIYYACVMFEIGFSLICTCIVLKINFKHPSHGDMPQWFRTIVLRYMAKLFRMTPQVRMAESQKKHFLKSKRKASIFASWLPWFSISKSHSPPRLSPTKRKRSIFFRKESQEKREEYPEERDDDNDEFMALTEITVETSALVEVESGSATQDSIDTAEVHRGSLGDNLEALGDTEGPVEDNEGAGTNEGTTRGSGGSTRDNEGSGDGNGGSRGDDEESPSGTSKENGGSSEDPEGSSRDDEQSPGGNGGSSHDTEESPGVFDDSLPECEHQRKVLKKATRFFEPVLTATTDPKEDMKCLACSHKSAVHIMVEQHEDLVKHVESLADMARDMEEEEIKKEEWKLAAAILDEFFFWLYLLMVTVSHAVVFSKIPKYD